MTLIGCGTNSCVVNKYHHLLDYYDLVSPLGELSPIFTTMGEFEFLHYYLDFLTNNKNKLIRGRALFPSPKRYLPRKWGGTGQFSNPGWFRWQNKEYIRERVRTRTRREFRKLLFQHTEKIVTEFDKYVISWDVCYALFDESGKLLRDKDLILDFYRFIKSLTDKPLFYDDYLLHSTLKWESIYKLVDTLSERGLIDGLGIQIHRWAKEPIEYTLRNLGGLVEPFKGSLLLDLSEIEISQNLSGENEEQEQVIWFKELYKLALSNDFRAFIIWSLVEHKDHVRNVKHGKTALYNRDCNLKLDLREIKI